MKKLFVGLVMMLGLVQTTIAQETKRTSFTLGFEQETASVTTVGDQRIVFGITRKLENGYDIGTFTLLSRSFSEGYVKLGRQFGPVHIAGGVGAESGGSHLRFAVISNVEQGPVSGSLVTEFGPKRFWYSAACGYQVTKKNSFNFRSIRGEGTGISYEREIRKHLIFGLDVLKNKNGVKVNPSITIRF